MLLFAASLMHRAKDYDVRGRLTQMSLLNFCEYRLDAAIDQITYIGELLKFSQYAPVNRW